MRLPKEMTCDTPRSNMSSLCPQMLKYKAWPDRGAALTGSVISLLKDMLYSE